MAQGFEIGSGFSGAAMLGSEHNDEFYMEGGAVRTRTNRSGGVQGGISNGEAELRVRGRGQCQRLGLGSGFWTSSK